VYTGNKGDIAGSDTHGRPEAEPGKSARRWTTEEKAVVPQGWICNNPALLYHPGKVNLKTVGWRGDIRSYACLAWGQGWALALGTNISGCAQNLPVETNHILMHILIYIYNLMQKIHNEQNVKILNKDRISITDFSFALGS
jgi:hypothetical protein